MATSSPIVPVTKINGVSGHFSRAMASASCPLNPGDRKSTRLNSSHSQISYAVFCLKKKKDDVYDPDDMSIVYAIETDGGIREHLIDAYVIYANPEFRTFLRTVPVSRSL